MLMRVGQVSSCTLPMNIIVQLICRKVYFHSSFSNYQSCPFCIPGAQMEVDYTEKLNFSDDEENQAAKDKRENW